MSPVADNYVAISVRATDGAKPDLTALKARLEELNKQVATARADVNDSAADAALTDLQAKLDAIGKKVASPKIDLAGASRALAQLTAVDAAARRLGVPEGDQAGGGFSRAFLGRIDDMRSKIDSGGILGQGGASKAGASAGGIFGSSFVQTFLGGKKTVILGGISSMLATLPALGAVAGVGMVAGLGTMIASKLPGVTAQFKTFGAQAMGTLETAVKPLVPFITGALGQMSGLLKQIAPELSGLFKNVGPMIAPLVSGIGGLVKGLLPGLSAILKAAMPAVQAFGSVLGSLGGSLGKMFAVMAPAVAASAGVMKALFGAIGGLLPVIGKLGAILAGALAPVLVQVAGAVTALEPAFTAVGKVVGEFAQAFLVNLSGGLTAVIGLVKVIAPAFGVLAGALGQAFNLMNNRGVLNDLEDAFEELVGPIGKLVIALVDGLVPVLPAVMGLATAAADAFQQGLVSAVTALVGAVIPLIPVLSKVATIIADVLASGVMALTPLLVKLAPTILAIVGAVKLWSIAQGILDAVMSANPLILIGVAIVALVGAIVELVKHWNAVAHAFDVVRHDVAAIVVGMWHDVTKAFDGLWKDVEKIIGDVVKFARANWPLLVGIFLGPIALIVAEVIQHWSQITSETSKLYHDVISWVVRLFDDFVSTEKSGIESVVSFFKGLPGRILSAVGDLGNLLYSAGEKIVQGLINGIKSMIGDVGGAIGSVVSEVKNFLPFSPAKKGPLSGSGSPDKSGASITRMLKQGMLSGLPDLSSAMAKVTGAVSGGAGRGGAAAGAGAGGGLGTLTLKFDTSDSEIMTAMMRRTRAMGGDPRIFTTKVVFR